MLPTHLFLKENLIYVTPDHLLNIDFVLPARLRCPQHHLQCFSGSVSKLQQPVRRRLGHGAQSRIQPLPRVLISGPDLLEEVLAPFFDPLPHCVGFKMTPCSSFLTHILFTLQCYMKMTPHSCFILSLPVWAYIQYTAWLTASSLPFIILT